MTLARVARALAIVIAVLAAIDPVVTLQSRVPTVVSIVQPDVVQSDSDGNGALVDRVANRLSGRFTVVRGLTADAAAVVSIGDRLPRFADTVTVPAFVVRSSRATVTIDELTAPARTHIVSRVPVHVSAHLAGAAGRTVTLKLFAGDVALDQITKQIATADESVEASLTFAPSTTGPVALRVTAMLSGAPAIEPGMDAAADTVVRVDRRQWRVLVFERHPSWTSTFVRRAIEDDVRFAVESRTETGRGVTSATPNAPAGFNAAAVDRFDALVVGAPEALTAADVATLDDFMRIRGGAVVCLWDARPAGPAAALAGVTRWDSRETPTDTAIVTTAGELRASEIAWTDTLPPRATVIVSAQPDAAQPARPVIWSAPVGAGRLVTGTALDSWRYRGAPKNAFNALWRQLIADAADAAEPLIDVQVDPPVLRPGDDARVEVRARGTSAGIAAHLVSAAGSTPVRLWPGPTTGTFTGTVRAPEAPGAYRLVASSGPDEGDTDVLINANVRQADGRERDVLGAWTASRGGAVIDEARESTLVTLLDQAVPPVSAALPRHPMRSIWWLPAFTLLSGIEWWVRRRRGLR